MLCVGVMDFILFLGLIGAAAFFWQRIQRLEGVVDDLTSQLAFMRQEQIDASQSSAPPPDEGPAEEFGEAEPASSQSSVIAKSLDAESDPNAAAAVSEDFAEPTGAAQSDTGAEPQSEYQDGVLEIAGDIHVEEPAEAVSAYDAGPKFTFDFEDIFGRRLPIWGGGFALAIAGIFLVRFSIEAGLLTPLVRVALSFLFGLGLLAGAEAAFRFEERLRDPRVRQSLAGAGLATLYGAFYLAGTAYGLIGGGAAFIGLAGVTAGAIALSFRFGLPSAIIGLVGGFAAPLLVESDGANVPLLSFYLALITGGLAWAGQAQGRGWLGYAALAAGLAWGVLMMVSGVSSTSDFAALGLYLVVLGSVLPAFLHAKGGPSLPKLAAGAIATLQMAVLVGEAGFDALTWGLYLLIGAALAGLGWRYPTLRLGTLVAAGLGLWLLFVWPEPDANVFGLVTVGQIAIFGLVPLAYQWLGRARLLDLAQLGIVALGLGIALYVRLGGAREALSDPALSASLAALALVPAIAFYSMWRGQEEGETQKALAVIAPTALLFFASFELLVPEPFAPVIAMLVTLPILWCFWRRDALALHSAGWAGALFTLFALLATPDFVAELSHLGTQPEEADLLQAIIRWGAATFPFLTMAVLARSRVSAGFAEVGSVVMAYGLVAQVLPSDALAWFAGLGAIGLMIRFPERIPAWTTGAAIAGLWAFEPVAMWLTAGALALIGDAFLAGSAIAPMDIALRVVPLAAALAVLSWKADRSELRAFAVLGFGLIVTVAVHSLYKQAWGITSMLRFEWYGMGERTLWQALFVLVGYCTAQFLPRNLRRWISTGLIATGLIHFAWFTLVLHNPLVAVQHVGPTPIANWLALAYGTAIAGIWLLLRQWEEAPHIVRRAADAVIMLLIALLAYSLSRHIFAGSILTSREIGQTESLLISLLGIALALGYLWWGSRRENRSWRIGSLVLMLAAVIKVFLIDAAGLEGLLRIASFMVLGFSLIGIGWVYSRQLSTRKDAET